MGFAALADAMLTTATRQFGVDVIYKRGPDESQIRGVFDAVYEKVDPRTGMTVTSTNPLLGVRAADLPSGMAIQGDRVVVAGVEYRVNQPEPDGEGGLTLDLHKV